MVSWWLLSIILGIRRAQCKFVGMATNSPKLLWYFIFRWIIEPIVSSITRNDLIKIKL